MLYSALRAVAGVSLRWYYDDVIVQGRGHVPTRGPVLVVANHPNALVDALLVGTVLSRRVLLTGKATLFEHPAMARLLEAIGVVPLARLQDERGEGRIHTSPRRNEDAFRLVTEALRRDGVVLVFPEGISHDQPFLAPMKSGASRMALRARDAGVRGLHVLPVGLVFEQKERLGSRVLVRIGPGIDLDANCEAGDPLTPGRLTRRITEALHAVTLGFATDERAARAVRLARALAALAGSPRLIDDRERFPAEVEIAARIERATEALGSATASLVQRADAFVQRLTAFEQHAVAEGVGLEDARISLRARHGAQFALREMFLLLLGGPVAALGWVVHEPPIRVARALALRTLVGDPSRDQPAMRTILAGTVLMVGWYAMLAGVATTWFGVVGAGFLVALCIAAGQVQLALAARLRRAVRRARTYVRLKRDSRLRDRLLAEVDSLLAEAASLERALIGP